MAEVAKKQWQELIDAKSEDKPKAFVKYAQEIIKNQEAGKLTVQEAGDEISFAAAFIDELLEIPEFNPDVINLGCDLQMPPQHRSFTNASDQEIWLKLKTLISDYTQGKR